LNPAGAHVGDLPNLVVGDDRRGTIDLVKPGLRLADGQAPLLDLDGSSVIIHAAPDDYKTDPTGNSGARIACAVLARQRQRIDM
jgi:Cu-Zn family superoxide dismutase